MFKDIFLDDVKKKENTVEFFLPFLPLGTFKRSQTRWQFIRKAHEFMGMEKTDVQMEKGEKYIVEVDLFFLGEAIIDIDNALKSVFDCIKHKVIGDDRDIRKVTCTAIENSGKVGVGIRIQRI